MFARQNNMEIKLNYTVSGDDFLQAGQASTDLKKRLKKLGLPSDVIRRTTIALYEGEINQAIHAGGGEIDVVVTPDRIQLNLNDAGPGIPDIDLAMSEGYSTASVEVREMGFGAGMGLSNMKKHTDLFIIESDVGKGTHITMEVNVL